MSTPITDAAYDAVRSFTNEEQAVDALMEMRETSRKLERENAALREDKERLLDILQRWQRMADEWYAEADQYGFGEPNITAGMINDTRAAIDAARKEAQP